MEKPQFRETEVPRGYIAGRLKLLKSLLDTTYDKPIKWREIRAVKKPFYDSYIYKNEEVGFEADPLLIERIRGFAVFSLIRELQRLGAGDQVRTVVPKLAPEPQQNHDENDTPRIKGFVVQREMSLRRLCDTPPSIDELTERTRVFGMKALVRDLMLLGRKDRAANILLTARFRPDAKPE